MSTEIESVIFYTCLMKKCVEYSERVGYSIKCIYHHSDGYCLDSSKAKRKDGKHIQPEKSYCYNCKKKLDTVRQEVTCFRNGHRIIPSRVLKQK